MSVWYENGPKEDFQGVTELADGNGQTIYLLINIPEVSAFCDGMKMHIKSWGDAFNFNAGQPQANLEWQGLHGFRFAVYDKDVDSGSNHPGELVFQSGWINPPVVGEYVYRFEPKAIQGRKIFVAFTRICAFLTQVDNTALNMLTDRNQAGPELTQGGWSAGPFMTDSFLNDATSESLTFFANTHKWCAISYAETTEQSDFAGHDNPTDEGLYFANEDFTLAPVASLEKVRSLKQMTPVQRNFNVSKTDFHLYIGSSGAGEDVAGRFKPPYTGPEDELFTPSAIELLNNPDLHDENISDSLSITSGVDGLDLTDAI